MLRFLLASRFYKVKLNIQCACHVKMADSCYTRFPYRTYENVNENCYVG